MTSPAPNNVPVVRTMQQTALSPAAKVFLASAIMLLGLVAAIVQMRLPGELPTTNSAMDPNLLSAPLPGSEAGFEMAFSNVNADLGAGGTVSSQTLVLASHTTEQAIPSLRQSVDYDKGADRYGQALPQPFLVVDQSVLSDEEKRVSQQTQEKNQQTLKPFVAVDAKFEPIHQFQKLSPTTIKDIPSDKIQQITPPPSNNDALLPLFENVENLEPIRNREREKENAVPPQNPFESAVSTFPASISPNAVSVTSASATPMSHLPTDIGVKTPFNSNTLVLQPLQPLVPKQESGISPPPTGWLVPLQPLAPASTIPESTTRSLEQLPPLSGLLNVFSSSEDRISSASRLCIRQ